MTATIPAEEAFRQALDTVNNYPLQPATRPPLFHLPPTVPRALDPTRGEVVGVDGDAWDTAARLRKREIDVEAVVARASGRIAAHSTRLNAFEHVAEVEKIAYTLASEAARGEWRGPLHGLPMSVKDIIDVEGMPTSGSSIALATRMATRDGVAVSRLREAGAVIMGKTVTHEFALGVTTPQSCNPWDESRLPGGSSGGSAISLVTGMALASLGTDTRASIRVPAALSGVVGFRPSTGLVPVDSWITLSWSLDVLAPMARSVRDIAMLMDVLTDSGTDFRSALPGSMQGLRVGYAEAFRDDEEPGVVLAFENAMRAVEDAGGRLVHSDRPSREDLMVSNMAGMVVSRAEAAQSHLEAGTDLSLCIPEVREQLSAAGHVPATSYIRGLRLRHQLYERFLDVFEDVDLLLMPTSKVVAPPRDDAERFLLVLSENCIPWSFVGFPAISLFAGMSDGLPTGVQLVAPAGQDMLLLSAAHALERLLPAVPEWQA